MEQYRRGRAEAGTEVGWDPVYQDEETHLGGRIFETPRILYWSMHEGDTGWSAVQQIYEAVTACHLQGCTSLMLSRMQIQQTKEQPVLTGLTIPLR